MKYLIGALAGLVWGCIGAVVNFSITKKALKKGSSAALLSSNILRVIVDIILLAVIVLLRKSLPFSYEIALVGTISALSLANIFFAFRNASEKD